MFFSFIYPCMSFPSWSFSCFLIWQWVLWTKLQQATERPLWWIQEKFYSLFKLLQWLHHFFLQHVGFFLFLIFKRKWQAAVKFLKEAELDMIHLGHHRQINHHYQDVMFCQRDQCLMKHTAGQTKLRLNSNLSDHWCYWQSDFLVAMSPHSKFSVILGNTMLS